MKKILALFLTVLTLFACYFSLSCGEDKLVIKESDTFVVITVNSNQLEITDDTKLIDYMLSLKQDGLLEFEITGGMISSINGIENPLDWSSCWMIYTDDEEYSSEGFGTIEYKGKTYKSAIFGAETLPIKDGAVYIWVFKAF